ncbi:hypothetical protein C1I98_02900 [Spongiactinospora gelatinilytica]|uniref:Uncharacterized protein n=1 Tax=Spongiactinospora gelatinilytica TaxID=2666298 RepID=A0A2W2J243_9ACTN|nr:hypothetical protein [Spongiactinospora gelatinilytica]PZG55654.1 hypothetical protein C1I98_02900 [Spongiactinospora gelatinilytica]
MLRRARAEARRLITWARDKADALPYGRGLTPVWATTAHTPSPLARAEDPKRRRDALCEYHAITDGHAELTSAPWYPAIAGDVLHIHYEASGQMSAFGETYVIEHSDKEDGLVLRLLAHTSQDPDAVGFYAPGMVGDPLMEPWMESGPASLTLVRDGRVIHPGR